jgi:hypothetical protein
MIPMTMRDRIRLPAQENQLRIPHCSRDADTCDMERLKPDFHQNL